MIFLKKKLKILFSDIHLENVVVLKLQGSSVIYVAQLFAYTTDLIGRG